MRRILTLFTVLTMMVGLSLSAAVASAAPRGGSHRLSPLAQEVGDSVAIPDIDGKEIGTVTVTNFDDNFTDFSEKKASGLQYVSLTLKIKNSSKDAIPVEPGNIAVVDDRGLLYTDIDVTRKDDVEELESGQVEAGKTMTGAVEIGFPDDRELAQVVWVVGQGQLPTLMNQADPVEKGSAVSLYDQNYAEEAQLTVDKATVDFKDYSDDITIKDGLQVVGVQLTIENTGDADFTPDPASVFLSTTDGVFWAADSSITRPDSATEKVPDLTGDPIAPGDSTTGFVAFSIFDTQTVNYVFYLPDSYRLIRLWDNPDRDADANATPSSDSSDSSNDSKGSGDLGPVGSATKTPAADNTNTKSSDDCAGASDYQDATLDNITAWSDAINAIDFDNIAKEDPDVIRNAADAVTKIADDQKTLDTPPAAEAFNKELASAFAKSGDLLTDLATAVEDGDKAGITDARNGLADIGTSFQTGDVADALTALKDVCPEIDKL